MASSSSSSSSNNIHHIRSISLPSRSHPVTLQVEEELHLLRTWEASASSMPTAETICSGLHGLEKLYKCVNDLLGLPLIQQAISCNHDEKLVDELLDQSIRLLDVCGSTRDAMLQIKEHVRNVQSAQRRRKGDTGFDISLIKKLKKDAKRAISALKHVQNKHSSNIILDLDHQPSVVIRSLRDASAMSISVFEALLSFVSVSISKPTKSSRWSVVSKLIHKETTESKDQTKISIAGLESRIEVVENGLECMFRSLIKTRSSLLNIGSH